MKQYAVVHRPRYGEWGLPKGKPLPGESLPETALREMREETGYQGRITGFAGAFSYLVDGGEKVVVFWEMTPIGSRDFKASEEVDRVEWVRASKAMRLLHPEERQLIESLDSRLSSGDAFEERPSSPRAMSAFRFWLRRRSESYQTLRGAVTITTADLRDLAHPGESDASPRWARLARDLLDKASSALVRETANSHTMDEAWWCLLGARRKVVSGMQEDRLQVVILGLRNEAKDKLTGWRRQTVLDLLGDDSNALMRAPIEKVQELDVDEKRHVVEGALLIRDEESQNEYRKVAALRRRLAVLGVILGAAIASSIAYAAVEPLPLGSNPPARLSMVLAVLIVGLLGGGLSAFRPLVTTAERTRFPHQVANWMVTLMRPVVGMAGALSAYVLVSGGLLGFENIPREAVVAMAFVAGFSEKFLMRAAASAIAGRDGA